MTISIAYCTDTKIYIDIKKKLFFEFEYKMK